MYNASQPNLDDLPTPATLRKYSAIAAIGAVAIGVMVYLPAEYGTDPTGVGSLLGLTEMGEIKQQLAAEAAADELLHGGGDSSSLMNELFGLFIGSAQAQEAWRDEITFTLQPGASTEIKVTLEEGASLTYAWAATGGRVNFDLHAHADGNEVGYEVGRGQSDGEGTITAPFAGDHGWFWRNRDKTDLTVVLQLGGDYTEIVRSE